MVSEFTFEIKDGLVTNVSAVTNGKTTVSEDGKTLTVEDAPILYINKKALGGEEIPAEAGGATFVLTAEDEGKTLEGVKINDGEALGGGARATADDYDDDYEYDDDEYDDLL